MPTIAPNGDLIMEEPTTVLRDVRRVAYQMTIGDLIGADPHVSFSQRDQTRLDGVAIAESEVSPLDFRLSDVAGLVLPLPGGGSIPVLAIAAGLRVLWEIRSGLHPEIWTPPQPPADPPVDPPPEGEP